MIFVWELGGCQTDYGIIEMVQRLFMLMTGICMNLVLVTHDQ